MAVPSPVGDIKIVSPVSSFVLNTLTLKQTNNNNNVCILKMHPSAFTCAIIYSKLCDKMSCF